MDEFDKGYFLGLGMGIIIYTITIILINILFK